MELPAWFEIGSLVVLVLILAADLLAYRQAQEHRFALLDELAREAQELGLP